jgi:membrane protease YdiL (CAAX protease family)
MTPQADAHEYPFWSYEDLALFAGSVVPCLAVAAILVRAAPFPSEGIKTIAFQSVFYALLLVTLYLLVAYRYQRPLWRSLGWTFPFRGAWWHILAGPALAIGLAALGAILRAPESSTIQKLLTDRRSLAIVVLFGSLLGPAFEESVFRGFLLPLFVRSLGPWPGIVLTAIPFALLHGSQYEWAWQSILIVGLAGVVFGLARYKTGSTAAAVIIHVGYNTTLFVAFLFQGAAA